MPNKYKVEFIIENNYEECFDNPSSIEQIKKDLTEAIEYRVDLALKIEGEIKIEEIH